MSVEGFVEMERSQLEALLNSTLSTDRMKREEEFKNATLAARVHPEKNQRPSVEALLHHSCLAICGSHAQHAGEHGHLLRERS